MKWSNWYGNQSCTAAEVATPRNEEQVVELVRRAAGRGHKVRPAGSGHSNVPLIGTEGTVIDMQHFSGLVSVDADARQVTVLPGTRICDLGPLLWEHGLSLSNQGDIDGQQIAGALATGTHGTGITLGSLSASLVGARVVRADGTVASVDTTTPVWLRAARTSLGALGVMTEMTLQVTDAYSLVSTHVPYTWDELHAEWTTLLESHRHFLFYWFPSTAAAGAWFEFDPPLAADTILVRTMDQVPLTTPAEDGTRRVGRAYRVFPDPSEPDFHELEFMVSLENAQDALGALRSMVLSRYPDHPLPLEVRFIAADDAYLSPFAGRASCSISISGVMGEDNSAFFNDCEQVFAAFAGRPHWGKWHPYRAGMLSTLYPDFDRFREVRAAFDPEAVFGNDYLMGLLEP